jgi:predicted site-specific integrase-resolvase
MPITYSTGEVARKIGVAKMTLLRWLYAGRLEEPRHANAGGQDVRVWSAGDLARAKKFKTTNYRKAAAPGRGRRTRPRTKP